MVDSGLGMDSYRPPFQEELQEMLQEIDDGNLD
jgi:hypothetical protein